MKKDSAKLYKYYNYNNKNTITNFDYLKIFFINISRCVIYNK